MSLLGFLINVAIFLLLWTLNKLLPLDGKIQRAVSIALTLAGLALLVLGQWLGTGPMVPAG